MVVREAVVFRQVADLSEHGRRADREIQKTGGARRASSDTKQDLDQRGFPRPILAEKSEDLAALDSQAEALQCLDLAVVLDEVLGFDDRHGALQESPLSGKMEV